MGVLPVDCEMNSVSIESNRLYVQRWQAGKRHAGGERTGADLHLLAIVGKLPGNDISGSVITGNYQ